MTPAHLTSAGRLLCGDRHKSDLARLLGVDPSLVHRWANGKRPIPAWVWPRLVELLEERGGECARLAAELRSS